MQWRKITTSILIIYVRKRGDTKRTKKELQEFASYFEVMKNESVDAKWNMFQQRLIGIMDSCMPHKFIIPPVSYTHLTLPTSDLV